MAFIGYGDKWREHRRMFHQHFNPAAVQKYHPRTSQEVKKLLGRLIAQPDDFMQHIRTYVMSHASRSTVLMNNSRQDDWIHHSRHYFRYRRPTTE